MNLAISVCHIDVGNDYDYDSGKDQLLGELDSGYLEDGEGEVQTEHFHWLGLKLFNRVLYFLEPFLEIQNP